MRIKIAHIAKIEGHASFLGKILKGDVKKARLIVHEGARLLEGVLRGRGFLEVSQISARICGICPVVHTLTSLKALEAALELKISQTDENLRKLLMAGQWLNSHSLHLFFFCLGDFFGQSDDLRLIKKHPKLTQKALLIRDFGNEIIEVVGGRSIHPLTPTVGGFLRYPPKEALNGLYQKSSQVLAAAKQLALIFAKIKYPTFKKPTNFASLTSSQDYACYDGRMNWLGQKKNQLLSHAQFMKQIQEFQVDYNQQTKRSYFQDLPYMVGALARLNNNQDELNPLAKKLLKESKVKFPQQNPFYNILAQAIEIVHSVEEAEKILSRHSEFRFNETKNPVRNSTGFPLRQLADRNDTKKSGYGAIEAPRGTLFYFYELSADGTVKNCNIITPTAQNLANLEDDLRLWLPELEKLSTKEREKKIKMLVRAYDPCLTCATH